MPDILHSLQIAAAPTAIFPLIWTAKGWAQWWTADVTECGGAIELGFFNRTAVYRLSSIAQNSPTRSEWRCETGNEWTNTRLVFSLERSGKGTILRFTHANWSSETDYL